MKNILGTQEEIQRIFQERVRVDTEHNKHKKSLVSKFIPFVMGAAFGGISRLANKPIIMAVPPIITAGLDMTCGGFWQNKRQFFIYAQYAAGAALPYADIIYVGARDFLRNL